MAQILQGIAVSSGVAQGRVFLLHAEPLPVVPNPIPPERVDLEVQRFEDARSKARGELEQLQQQVHDALGEGYAGILGAQLVVLDDPALVGETIRRIRVGRVSARWALKEVVGEFIRKFEVIDDEYLKERGGELSDVHLRESGGLPGREVATAPGSIRDSCSGKHQSLTLLGLVVSLLFWCPPRHRHYTEDVWQSAVQAASWKDNLVVNLLDGVGKASTPPRWCGGSLPTILPPDTAESGTPWS